MLAVLGLCASRATRFKEVFPAAFLFCFAALIGSLTACVGRGGDEGLDSCCKVAFEENRAPFRGLQVTEEAWMLRRGRVVEGV